MVIPAHNEAQVIGPLLDSLLAADGPGAEIPGDPEPLEIVVVCNGCTDGTAQVAAARGARVRVVEIPVPSKHEALRAGDAEVKSFPRLYVDADVLLSPSDVRSLTQVLSDHSPAVLAVAPERDIPLNGCGWPVRAYYRVWQRLPEVRRGLFGRGVIAVTEAGHARLAALPPLMADDLAASLAFAPEERRVVPAARVRIQPPRTWRDLINRRVRAATSTAQLEQLEQLEQRTEAPSARTRPADLFALLRADPALLPGVLVFLAAAAVARRRARQPIRSGDFGTWLRDESSRSRRDRLPN
ncbi:glycosyltransferase [Phaeacidiphilus oryzae]|uniref:glycosyltransferase n=1 Tax=Phaeacidiphilus oryzae TaxID=348818 RepID=UPI001F2F7D0F|nr:glycosyltransferase [Phaeacidiphilus oryzae]